MAVVSIGRPPVKKADVRWESLNTYVDTWWRSVQARTFASLNHPMPRMNFACWRLASRKRSSPTRKGMTDFGRIALGCTNIYEDAGHYILADELVHKDVLAIRVEFALVFGFSNEKMPRGFEENIDLRVYEVPVQVVAMNRRSTIVVLRQASETRR